MARRRPMVETTSPASPRTTLVSGRVSVCPANIPASGPVRRCVASGRRGGADGMVRFVVSPGGEVVPDLAGRLPGRGFWLRPERDMMRPAVLAREIAKAAGTQATVPDDLSDRLERLLVERCMQVIGLARRAGQVVTGFEKVAAGLRSGTSGVLVEAADGARDGRRKLRALAPDVPVVSLFTAAELGAVLGRESATHVLVCAGKLAARLRSEAAKLEGLRGAGEAVPPGATTSGSELHLEA